MKSLKPLWYRVQQRVAITSQEALTLAAVAGLLAFGSALRLVEASELPPAASADLWAPPPADVLADPLHADPVPQGEYFRIDPNAASAGELTRLPRIGPALAGRIIAQRERSAFGRPEDLLAVPGIGPKTLEQLRPHLAL